MSKIRRPRRFLAIRDKVAAAEIEAYEDNTVKEPLIPEGTTLEGSPVKKTAQNAEYGTTEWTLANGVKVIVKPTAYKADEVRMSAWPRAACRSSRTRSSTWAR